MKQIFRVLLSHLILSFYSYVGGSAELSYFGPKEQEALDQASSLLVVVSSGWGDIHGSGQIFIKRDGTFAKEGAHFPVVLGRTGMAWGIGISDYRRLNGPNKVEGDGHSPAGFFTLNQSFGDAKIGELPFLKIAETHVCVDDSTSKFYNKILDASAVSRDWSSFEQMKIPLYSKGIEVMHNFNRPHAKGGSCIFIHLWRNADSATSGCTAMADDSIQAVLAALGPSSLFIQLPTSEIDRLALPF